jgi:predicted 3-demethylubiquinone-9 3-methyltransferase (glyoxalase superfamily)
MQLKRSITPFLWFDDQAEEAARHYVEIFGNSKILGTTHFSEAGQEIHGRPSGSVMTVSFELNGQPFSALNGGPMFKFSEAISFQVLCDNQEEVDYFWERLREGGDVDAQQCGWLKDRFGVSWQVVPVQLFDLIEDPHSEASQRATSAMLQMKKLDIQKLTEAYEGGA